MAQKGKIINKVEYRLLSQKSRFIRKLYNQMEKHIKEKKKYGAERNDTRKHKGKHV